MTGIFGGWKKYVVIYLVALAVSHLVTHFFQNPIVDRPAPQKTVQLPVVEKDQSLTDKTITVGYQDIYHGSDANPEIIVLLPGGLEGPEVFEKLVPHLATDYRVIIPNLPGYQGQNDDLPSYSFKTLSVYTTQFLEQLELSDTHVFGFGLGGASAIHLAHDNPDKIASLGLIAAIGVQELELLGSYRLNHAVHGMQLAAVWILHNMVPHFGLFEMIELDVSYAKKHYESDQRPLRSHLQEYQKPMLIIHGKDDPLVPLAAAQEHHRIVPQSELKVFNADHNLLETHSDSISSAVKQFVQQVDQNQATTAQNASQERIKEAKKSFSNVDFARFKGVSLLIIMLIIILGMFLSEDLTAIGAGLLVARGLIGLGVAILACFLGLLIWNIGLYVAGRILGRPAIQKAPFKWIISQEDLEKSAQWFKAKGPAIIVASRFLPGSRMPTYFSAGVIQAGFWMFIFYFILSAVIWTPLIVGVSKLLGNEILHYFSMYQNYAIWIFIGAIAVFFILIKLIIPAFSYKGRRLLVSRYRKLTHWQYWWTPLIYVIPAAYILYLGIKHRCLTLFTAANPACNTLNLVSPSKSSLLDLFGNNKAIAKYYKISFHQDIKIMLNEVHRFMENNRLDFPVILKPDTGKSGRDVRIVKDRFELQDYLSNCSEDIVIQEYISGIEADIFFAKNPDKDEGVIFSVARKEIPKVVGDGEKTIQELILSHNNHVALAPTYLMENEDQLYQIPDEGETINLLSINSVAKGATIIDDASLNTEKLTSQLFEICSAAQGINVCHFTIKAPSYDDLQKGENLKIIDIEEGTSLPASIYDLKHSFLSAQKIINNQWQFIFSVGQKNREEGAKVLSTRQLLGKLFQDFKSINEIS